MKKNASNRAAAYIAGCVLLLSTSISSAAYAGSVYEAQAPFATTRLIDETKESFSLELKQLANTSTIHLVIQKPAGRRVWITLKGPDGDEIEKFYTDKKTHAIFRNYNFSEAVEGTYSFEITDGAQTIKKIVRIASITPKAFQQFTVE